MGPFVSTSKVAPLGLEPRLFASRVRRVASYTKGQHDFPALADGHEKYSPRGTAARPRLVRRAGKAGCMEVSNLL